MTSFILNFSFFVSFPHLFFLCPTQLSLLLSLSFLPKSKFLFLLVWQHTHLPASSSDFRHNGLLFSKPIWWAVRRQYHAEVHFQHRINIQKIDFSVHFPLIFSISLPLSFTALPLHVVFVSPLAFSLSACHSSTLFCLTAIKPYFSLSPDLSVLAHNDENPRTLAYKVEISISKQGIPFQSNIFIFVHPVWKRNIVFGLLSPFKLCPTYRAYAIIITSTLSISFSQQK